MSVSSVYDEIGRGYARGRQPDLRIAGQVMTGLGDTRSVLNVGAGTGSYEPTDRMVVATEPSAVMIAQRRPEAAPVVRARAEALPFSSRAFDAVLAVLTVHHWADPAAGLAECARVARDRVVLLTWDPATDGFWLVKDYLPTLATIDRHIFPGMDAVWGGLGRGALVEIAPVPIPRDCGDGFLGAYWARPAAYLEAEVRASISSFARAGAEEGLERLRKDLATGAWQERYGRLLEAETLDVGYRLVIAHLALGHAS